jgi:hypothetical protein
MTSHVEELLARLPTSAAKADTDWDAVRSVSMKLDCIATTKEKKSAVARLKDAGPGISFGPIIVGIEEAFLRGKPGADGWPRR